MVALLKKKPTWAGLNRRKNKNNIIDCMMCDRKDCREEVTNGF